jgi:hypothetical protein
MITQERLKELLHYDFETGKFTYTISRGHLKKGATAGCEHPQGYIYIVIDCKNYAAHRLVWLYVYGFFPPKYIDHINQIKNDNRLSNLRETSHQENLHNRTPKKSTGVSFRKDNKKFSSRITVNKKIFNLGLFDTLEEAHQIYLSAKRKFHPFWQEV